MNEKVFSNSAQLNMLEIYDMVEIEQPVTNILTIKDKNLMFVFLLERNRKKIKNVHTKMLKIKSMKQLEK